MNRFFDFLEENWLWIVIVASIAISGFYSHQKEMKELEIRNLIVKDSLSKLHEE
jgi:hypothetical protein